MSRDFSRAAPSRRGVRHAVACVSALTIVGGCMSEELDAPAAPAVITPTPEVTAMSTSLVGLPTLLAAAIAPARAAGGGRGEELAAPQVEPLRPAETAAELARLKKHKHGKALHEHLHAEGFKPGHDARKDLYGLRTEYADPDRPDIKFTQTLVLQNYFKAGREDAAALASVTLTTKDEDGTNSTTYEFSLLAPDGRFDIPIEHTTDAQGAVVEAQSWYSCLTRRMTTKCGEVCKSAVFTCAYTTWAGYLGCLSLSCGDCMTVCTACCSCDCGGWCKQGVGCCDR